MLWTIGIIYIGACLGYLADGKPMVALLMGLLSALQFVQAEIFQ